MARLRLGNARDNGYFAAGFDPVMIVAQICAMQALLYLGLGAWLLLLNGLAGRPATAVGLEQVFSAKALRMSQPGGVAALVAFFLNALAGGGFLVLETNFRLYAYTNSSLWARVLQLFLRVDYMLPNLIVAR